MKNFAVRRIASAVAGLFTVSTLLTGCGTMTGIPSHGGGKRFAVEQRLVAASIRSTLMDIDVSALKGQKVAMVFDMISDEGGGTLAGGRANILAGLTSAYVVSPVTSANSQFQIFNLTDTGTNFSNQNNTSTANTAGTSAVTGTTTGTNTQNTTSSGTSSSTGSGTNSSTTTGTNASTSSGSNTGTSTGSGTTATTTGAVTTNQTDSSSSNSSGTNTGTSSGTSSSTTNGTNTSTGNTTSTGTQNSTGTSSQNSTQNGTSTQNTTGSGTQNTTGGSTTNKQTVSPTPSATQTQTKGRETRESVTLSYQGLGEYHNFNVPKSDASLLMGLVRNYLLLNGVTPTIPTDPEATAILYVTVDIFGLVRSRFDMYVFNQENVRAETAIEMMAFDRSGKMIMRPQNANREAKYDENYFFRAGPFKTEEEVRKGKGLLVDFSKVDGSQKTYPADMQRHRWEGNAR